MNIPKLLFCRQRLYGLVLLAAVASPALWAQTPKPDVSARQQNAQILGELKAIRQLLEKMVSQQAAAPARADAPADEAATPVRLKALPSDHVIGKPDAPITMVEFTDLQCPFCREFHVTAFEQIKRAYIDTGKLRYISRDFPLSNIHPLARDAAKASRCAAEQGKFWEMRHAILVNNAGLKPELFDTFALDLGLNLSAFTACHTDPKRFAAELEDDQNAGIAARVDGTPTFVLGRSNAGALDGVKVVGALPFADFDRRIKELLAEK